MRNRMTSVCDRLIDFSMGIVNWLWDTFEIVFDILLEFLARAIELVIAILHLSFQIICFLRDVGIEAMQTFVNVFRGIVNVVSSIKCEDVEDFAAACMVVILFAGAVKIGLGVLEKRAQPLSNPFALLKELPSPRDKISTIVKNSKKPKMPGKARKGVRSKCPTNSSISSVSSVSELSR